MIGGERYLVMPPNMKDLISNWMKQTLGVDRGGEKLINYFNDWRYKHKKDMLVSKS